MMTLGKQSTPAAILTQYTLDYYNWLWRQWTQIKASHCTDCGQMTTVKYKKGDIVINSMTCAGILYIHTHNIMRSVINGLKTKLKCACIHAGFTPRMLVQESSTAGGSTLTWQLLILQGKLVVIGNFLSGNNPGGEDCRIRSE